ncbi:MAG TPA: hypothetical protein VHO50_09810 [Bacteroidales bacterium]|nr:hypothetical protein [Bacteroidales bacterium]
MKKRILKLFLLIIVPAMVLFSCKKDDFSEKDALDAQQTVDVVITVADASSSQTPVQGATVNLLVDSIFVSKTTNASGSVVFTDVKIGGEVAVTVTKDGYTSIMYTVDVYPESYRQTQVSEIVSIYSLATEKLATFKGKLTMQSDLTNRVREVAAGVIVKARNSYLYGTNQFFTATTDNDGNYTLAVPVSTSNNDITLYFPEFTTNQKLAFTQPDGTIAIAEREVLYRSDASPILSIPAVPSIYATIESPVASNGTGFALGSKPNRVPLNFLSLSGELISGGVGYNGGVTIMDALIPFSDDPDGNHADLQVDITDGVITNIDGIIPNTATYSVAPTLNLSTLSPTTPAVIQSTFRTTYLIYIANKGTGYTFRPQVSGEYEMYSGDEKVKYVDENINDWGSDYLGDGELLNNRTQIKNGMLLSTMGDGDTLITITSNYFTSAPVFTSVQAPSKKAIISLDPSDISFSDSTLLTIDIDNAGSGYNRATPPVITLTTIGGYGSGAVAKATVDSDGSLSSIYITNPGKGYVRNVNDWRKQDYTGNASDSPTDPSTTLYGVRAGEIYVQDVYYGTGYQLLNQMAKK